MKRQRPLFLFLLLPTLFFAQTKSIYQIGLSTGFTNAAIKSDAYSPLILSGYSAPFSLHFQKIKDQTRHVVEVGFLSVQPSEKFNTSIVETGGHLSYEWLKSYNSLFNSTKFRFYYGFSALFAGSQRRVFVPNLPNNNNAFDGSLTLNAALMSEYYDGQNRLTMQVNYALLGYQYGSLYDYAFVGRRFLSPQNVFQMSSFLRYASPISAHINIRMGYLFYLYRSATPQYLGVLRHQIELGLQYQF